MGQHRIHDQPAEKESATVTTGAGAWLHAARSTTGGTSGFPAVLQKGLVYRKHAPVNCESCKTVLANEQVVDDGVQAGAAEQL